MLDPASLEQIKCMCCTRLVIKGSIPEGDLISISTSI